MRPVFHALAAALALLACRAHAAAPLDGDWDGTLAAGPRTLRLVFHLEPKDGASAMISVDQGGARIPLGAVARDGQSVRIEVPAIHGGFAGTLAADGATMTGTWTQGAASLPLTLARRKDGAPMPGAAPAVPPPPGVTESDVTLTIGSATLGGTLTRPAGTASGPAVLMIAGSGPTDRNGNSSIPGHRPDTQRLLAYGLAAHGIASLRTDKRGIGASALAMTRESDLNLGVYVDDTRAWAAFLKTQTGAACVWLAGHSEGALIAERAAADNPAICGLVLLAGPGRKLGDILRAQLAHEPDARRQKDFDAIAALEAGRTIDRPADDLLFRPSVQPLWISEFAPDPAALLKGLRMPVLIVQGDADRNVLVEDAERLAAARPDAKLLIVPGMTHVLKVPPADGAADATTPLAPGLVAAVADFVNRR